MNISIAILDTNKKYVERLVEGLQKYDDLFVSVFTSVERLEQTLNTKKIDIVLFEPGISEEKIYFANVKMNLCFYSADAANMSLYADYKKVIKYQRISKLYKDILKLYADMAGYADKFDKFQSTRLIGVYSPIGGCGKTTVALALASKLVSYGKKVLFLSMEQINGSAGIHPHVEEGIIMLVDTINENSNFELKLKGSVKEGIHGITYLEGFERIVDYNTVTKNELKEIMVQIRKFSDADVVVFDMNSYIDDLAQVIFENVDNILVVERSGELAEKKMEFFAQQALVCEYLEKMCKIANFTDGNVDIIGKLDVPAMGRIKNYGNLPTQKLVQTLCTNNDINVSAWVK